MKKISLGIRSKIIAASLVIMSVLLLSGVIAFFEFGRMRNNISTLISDNINCVNITRNMLTICDAYQAEIFQQISDETRIYPEIVSLESFEGELNSLTAKLNRKKDYQLVDSVRYAYSAYMQVTLDVNKIWSAPSEIRNDWYFNKLSVVYNKFRRYLQLMADDSQVALADNYDTMKESYYRSMMPSIVAMGAGIVMVILFIYFLNIYIIHPILKMTKGLRDYKENNKTYNVTFDHGGDQIQEMNSLITDVLEENKFLKSHEH
ncbi:MAG: hypothetical protein IKC17_02925 [Bacteroidales bacterium]|nr:hypothetical protein [Bacteroidales bacterium]